jgi:hypothetical protein
MLWMPKMKREEKKNLLLKYWNVLKSNDTCHFWNITYALDTICFFTYFLLFSPHEYFTRDVNLLTNIRSKAQRNLETCSGLPSCWVEELKDLFWLQSFITKHYLKTTRPVFKLRIFRHDFVNNIHSRHGYVFTQYLWQLCQRLKKFNYKMKSLCFDAKDF